MINNIDYILYIDEAYLESVYNLSFPNIIETIETKNKSNKRNAKLESKLSKIIPIQIVSKFELDIDKVTIAESKVKPTIESKIKRLVDEKYKTPRVLGDLISDEFQNGVYFFDGTFELLSLKNNGKDYSKNKKYLMFPKGIIWEMKYVWFEESDISILMHLGGDKIKTNLHHLTEEIEKYKKFYFTIIGKISIHDVSHYSIKPIVIFY